MSPGHLWSARLYSIFSHYLIKGMIFESDIFEYKCVFYLVYNICLKDISF